MSSTALISCRMKIDLYLLNCYPLNPSILQTMSFVNSTCLKISKIIFCFTTIRWKNEGNIFTSLKDLTVSNAQFRDQNCCSSLRKLSIVFFLFFLGRLLKMIFSFVTKEPKISFLSLSSSSSFICLIYTIEKNLFTTTIARRRGDLRSHWAYGRAMSLSLINKVKKKCCEYAAKPIQWLFK